MKRVEATVYGLVQEVNFRYYTLRQAQALNLSGWVANQRNHSVRVVAEGPEEALRQLVDFLHQGSPAAQVDRVEVNWQTATGEFKRFQVKYAWA